MEHTHTRDVVLQQLVNKHIEKARLGIFQQIVNTSENMILERTAAHLSEVQNTKSDLTDRVHLAKKNTKNLSFALEKVQEKIKQVQSKKRTACRRAKRGVRCTQCAEISCTDANSCS